MIFDSQDHKDTILKLVSEVPMQATVAEAMKDGFGLPDPIRALYEAVRDGQVQPPEKKEPETD